MTTTSRPPERSGYIAKHNMEVEQLLTLAQIKAVLSADDMRCDAYDLDR